MLVIATLLVLYHMLERWLGDRVIACAVLVIGDYAFTCDRRWRPRIATLALLVAYLPLAILIRQGVTHPETEPIRPIAQIATSLRLDLGDYVLKTFGLFDGQAPAMDPFG